MRGEGIFIDKRERVKRVLTEEKLDDVAYFLQNSLRRLGQKAGISKKRAWRDTKLLKFRTPCIMVGKIFFFVIYFYSKLLSLSFPTFIFQS